LSLVLLVTLVILYLHGRMVVRLGDLRSGMDLSLFYYCSMYSTHLADNLIKQERLGERLVRGWFSLKTVGFYVRRGWVCVSRAAETVMKPLDKAGS